MSCRVGERTAGVARPSSVPREQELARAASSQVTSALAALRSTGTTTRTPRRTLTTEVVRCNSVTLRIIIWHAWNIHLSPWKIAGKELAERRADSGGSSGAGDSRYGHGSRVE
eukprot:38771-Hanusia_phi.AAC.2